MGRQFEAVFFDLYGTLFLSAADDAAWRSWLACLRRELETKGLDTSAIEDVALRKEFGVGDQVRPPPGQTIFEAKIEGSALRRGIDFSELELPQLAATLCEAWQSELTLDPEALALLGELRRDRKVAVVSNFDHPPHVHAVLAASGIRELVEDVVVSGDVGVKKPDPEILRIACARLDVAPQATMYVGDSIVDYQSAVGAGATPVIIRRKGQGETNRTSEAEDRYRDTDALLWALADSGDLTIIDSLAALRAHIH